MQLSFEHYIELNNGDEIMVDITYEVSGKHIPATMIDPAEEPEMEIQEVAHKGILLDYDREEMETLCWENWLE